LNSGNATKVGTLIGFLLTGSLIAVSYLGWKLFGLPFVPFQVFDWVARKLPGSIVTFGIDALVAVIRALSLSSTAEAAKTAEQIIAIAIFLAAGVVIGAVLFAVSHRWKKGTLVFGLFFGAAFGFSVLLISSSLDRPPETDPFLAGFWILVLFLLWGTAFGWSYHRLSLAREATDSAESESFERVNRRRFLIRLGGVTAAVTVLGAVVAAYVRNTRKGPTRKPWSANNALPNADASLQPAPGTRPEFTPLESHYRVDINTLPPVIDEETWRLKVGGLVEHPLELKLDDIRAYEPMHQFITLSCISNPVAGDLIGTTRWTGVSLQQLLPNLRLKPSATHLKISSADGFWEVIALEAINNDKRVMLAYAWDGVPLLAKHGFPLRIYIPDVYGMKQPKWIESIEAIDHWEPGYWVVRSWDREATMEVTSVIDAISVDEKIIRNGATLIPVGGIAHAGTRGISRVEVRVDDGQWDAARLRTPLSRLTWVIWRYEMPFQAGEHTLTVRCFDGNGAPQAVEPSPPHPDGATGLHSKRARL
jgi:DMSO/TMAO reductase YedYZ molybdopterin-dependent catalytic subunit